MTEENYPRCSLRKYRSCFRRLAGFSLVEVLAAVAIIGIITFLAIPNIVRVKEQSEKSLAISRAEALNLAMGSFVQANGQAVAANLWADAEDNDGRYNLIAPYLAFAPADIATYMPSGFSATLPTTILPLTKAALKDSANSAVSY